ncbi:polysaccharide biosynthesis/export family protein [Caulobacter endophyticus]|uniref:polysaccharide biosynthesis/export family protein n=1 Tax=Caulobacter endophyticus TaxID=2172652 RepID=UPI00240F826A|nr:polysaccharide biosynthesis/export family protein [Caulobacter endophyticus]MDG2527287.1 polysaccharide export protein [Caulobacter endophyticus]
MTLIARPRFRAASMIGAATALLTLNACANLPASGPTAAAIDAEQRRTRDFEILDIDQALVTSLAVQPVAGGLGVPDAEGAAPVDLLGPGDVLQIAIYEIGAALFAARSTFVPGSGLSPPSGAAEILPPVVVGQDGAVNLPWIGRVQAAGQTPDALAGRIAQALRNKSQDPQVVVSVRDNVANTVMVMGEVKKPGRVALSLTGERLLDVVALAGGPVNPVQDSVVQLSRDGRTVSAPLATIVAGSAEDVPLRPRDRIVVAYQPRTFTIFGATGKVSETPFQTPRVSLAEAIARAGGPSDQQADPSAVFVFRYEPGAADGAPLAGARPVAYRLDLLKPQSYFLAQGFEMRPRDVIYVANARANQSTKLIQVLNQFFSPIYTAKVIAK